MIAYLTQNFVRAVQTPPALHPGLVVSHFAPLEYLVFEMSTSGLKAISPVPTAAEFLDIVLSKTQRKTPTVRTYHAHINAS